MTKEHIDAIREIKEGLDRVQSAINKQHLSRASLTLSHLKTSLTALEAMIKGE